MFGTLGGPEIFLILVIALIVFGPRRLPDIGKSMGRMLAEFRKASNEFKRTLEDEVESEKVRTASAAAPATAPAELPPATEPSTVITDPGAASGADFTFDPLPPSTTTATPEPAGHQPAPHPPAGGEPGTVSRTDARPLEPDARPIEPR